MKDEPKPRSFIEHAHESRTFEVKFISS